MWNTPLSMIKFLWKVRRWVIFGFFVLLCCFVFCICYLNFHSWQLIYLKSSSSRHTNAVSGFTFCSTSSIWRLHSVNVITLKSLSSDHFQFSSVLNTDVGRVQLELSLFVRLSCIALFCILLEVIFTLII